MQIESNWKYKNIQLYKSVSVTFLTYVISPIVTKVSGLSKLPISVFKLKDKYYISFVLSLKIIFYRYIRISVILKSQCWFSIPGAGYIVYPD